jgi:MoxR-like ATPase
MVFATQNPIEMEGTYPLPEAQLDRFMLKVLVEAPNLEQFETILAATQFPRAPRERVLSAAQLAELQALCQQVVVPRSVLRYAARLCAATRPDASEAPELVSRHSRFGVSVRAGQALVSCGKARALMAGRAHVAFEDVRAVAPSVLRHRLLLGFEAKAEQLSADAVVDAVLARVDPHAEGPRSQGS